MALVLWLCSPILVLLTLQEAVRLRDRLRRRGTKTLWPDSNAARWAPDEAAVRAGVAEAELWANNGTADR